MPLSKPATSPLMALPRTVPPRTLQSMAPSTTATGTSVIAAPTRNKIYWQRRLKWCVVSRPPGVTKGPWDCPGAHSQTLTSLALRPAL